MPIVTILGAGIAGLSAGWLLQQRGIDFIILEKQSYPGGLARSFEWHGFYCDFAAHRLFTTREDVLQQLLQLVPMGRQIRRSCIYMRGHWMRDPLDIIELAQHLSLPERAGVLFSYLTRPRDLAEINFENYVLRRYGRSLYEYFFKPYTEKLFGIPGDEISVLWARQKVRLANPLDNLRENTKTKFQYFYYPLQGGYGAIANRLYQEIKNNVLLEANVTGIDVEDKKVTKIHYRIADQYHTLTTNFVISTLPLSINTRLLGRKFDFRFQKVEAVYLLINKPQLSDYHWIYFIDQDISINRLVEFKNMNPLHAPQQTTVICAEVTQQHTDPINKVIADLERANLIRMENILDTKVVREEFAYPVYTSSYDETLQAARQYIGRFQNLYILGRAAEFLHHEVDDNFAAAMALVEKISQKLGERILPTREETTVTPVEQPPRLFAVILTFNNYEDTRECIQSILRSDRHDIRIIVVDNGSSDGTSDKVREEFPGVYVIENGQNLGVPAGYNVGFRHALQQGADYILMLNNDTVIAPDMISRLLTHAEGDPQCGIVMPKVLYYGSEDRVWSSGGRYRPFPPAILMTDKRKSALSSPVRLIEFAPSCGLFIHRRAFERAGLFDPGYFFLFDDWDFSERVRVHGLHIWYVNQAIMWHKVSKTTRGPRTSQFWYTMGASLTRYYRRHGRPPWISLCVHLGYFVLREFCFKSNRTFWNDFIKGVRDGLQKPLGNIPQYQ